MYLFGFSCLVWLGVGNLPAVVGDLFLACLLPYAVAEGYRRRRELLSVVASLPFILLSLSLCFSLLACGVSARVGFGLLKGCQLVWYLALGPLVIWSLGRSRERLLKGLAVGFMANLAVGLVQGALSLGGPSGGLLGSRTGFGVGLAVASSLLMARDMMPLPWVTAPWGNVALMAYGATVSGMSGIFLGLGSLMTRYKNEFVIRERQLQTAPFLAFALVVLLASPIRRDALLDSVTVHDHGVVSSTTEERPLRRWVQERVCAWRAMGAKPWLGTGPGSYQSTVGQAEIRGTFNRPSETKVEIHSQNGWQVLGVEYGLPAAILLLLAMLVLGVDVKTRSIRWSVLLLILGMIFTPMLAKGSGLLVSLVLGTWLSGSESRKDVGWRLIPVCLLGLMLLLLPAICASGLLREPSEPAETQAKADFVLIMEAESVAAIRPFQLENGWISIPDKILESDESLRNVGLEYDFELNEAKELALWLKVRWQDGCGNSIFVSVDGQNPYLAGNDGTYNAWHWVRAGYHRLDKGTHTIKLLPSEDGIQIDQILLCDNREFHPQAMQEDKIIEPKQESLKQLPEMIPAERQLLFATGGPYRGGYEAVLTTLGLPWMKLHDYELESAELLKKYTVVAASDPFNKPAHLVTSALKDFAEAGGNLLLENFRQVMGDTGRGNHHLWPPLRRPWSRNGGTVTADDGWPFQGLEKGTVLKIADDIAMQNLHQPGKDSPWKGYGRQFRHRDEGYSIWERDLGKGHVIYCATPYCFQTMWRNRDLEPVLRNLILKYAQDAGHQPLWNDWTRQSLQPKDPCFADDFMRQEDNQPGQPWIVKSGRFKCTGDKPENREDAFSLVCAEPGEVQVGEAAWQDVVISASVKGPGRIAVQAVTTSGRDHKLEYDATTRKVELNGTNAINVRGAEWHRLSLLARTGWLEAYCDGSLVAKIKLENPNETLHGNPVFSFSEIGGMLDDVSIRSLEQVLPGTDRAIGDEGSCLALDRISDEGIERSTIFSPYVWFQVLPAFRNGVRLSMPLFKPGVLHTNGTGYLLQASNELLEFALPETEGLAEIYVETPYWKDYVFKKRMTDWYGLGGKWEQLERWSCDDKWSWLGVETEDRAALWNKLTLSPPFAIRAFLSLGARDYFSSEYDHGQNMNLVFGGDGASLDRGWQVRGMDARGRGIELWHAGQLVASNRELGLGRGHTLHHSWFEIAAVVQKDRIRVYFEGRLAIDHQLQEPIGSGQVGLWTEKNSIRVGRIQLSW